MQLKTILKQIEDFKSFVYGRAKWVEDGEGPRIEVAIAARKNGRPICSGWGRPAPGYDRLPERRFEFVPLWGIAGFFV
jgi:transposase